MGTKSWSMPVAANLPVAGSSAAGLSAAAMMLVSVAVLTVMSTSSCFAQTAPTVNPYASPPAEVQPAAGSGNSAAPSLPTTSKPPASQPQTAEPAAAIPAPPPVRSNNPAGGAKLTGSASSASGVAGRYVLGPNDVVGVSVWGDKNLTGSYAIGPDGQMSMYLIGDFKANGLTLLQLQDTITDKLHEWMNDPLVNVQLLRSNSKKYTVMGGVLKAGAYPLLQNTTVLDALAGSGGFKDFANKKKIIVMRGTKRFPFNYTDVMKGKHMEQNINLEDGDIISVPGE